MDKIVALRSKSDLQAVEQQWRDLARRVPNCSLAQTFEYGLAAFGEAGATKEQRFLVEAWDGEVLTGIWGLTRSRDSIHRVLRPFSCGTNEEYSGPLVGGEDPVAVAERILRLATTIDADRLILYNIAPDGPCDRAAARMTCHQSLENNWASVVPVKILSNWDSVEKCLNKKDRWDLRHYAKKLKHDFADEPIRIGWSRTAEESDQILDFIVAQKRRWLIRKHRRSLWLQDDRTTTFFKRLARVTNHSEYPLTAAVEIGSRPIAGAICLQSSAAIEYHVTAYDPDYRQYGPSKLLLNFIIGWALERKRDFDFCLTLARYKEEWPIERKACRNRTFHLTLVGRAPSQSEIVRTMRKGLAPLGRRVKRAVRRFSQTPSATT
jgi:CelD/BcsL family acetyltransferase involved in cellulose biosynthesis